MTEDEILAEAEKIIARRKRSETALKIMQSDSISIIAHDGEFVSARVYVDPSPELAAYLCHALDCFVEPNTEKKE